MSGPHDLFVRFTFGHPERAAAELRVALPPPVVSAVDWATLRRESSSVVDPELRETESDLLFTARLLDGRPLLLYVLLEHQSSVDRWMALRMLRYVVRLLERWRKEHPEGERLPVVIPLVMYHGPEGAWSAPRRVEALFDLPDQQESRAHWEALVPRFEYLLDDLTAERAEALMARPGPPLVRLALLVLRFGRTEELARRLPEWTALFAQLKAHPSTWDELVALVRYLFQVGDTATRAALSGVLASVMDARRTEELMKTIGEELIEQGMARGLAKGLAKGREEGLAKGLARSVLRVLDARGLGVDDKARQRILSCTDLDLLEQWLERAVTASSLSDVLGRLPQ
jgi:predicted transposase/invertase (TIGR01784 family)